MTDISFIGNNRPETASLAHSRPAEGVQGVPTSPADAQNASIVDGDRVEISDHARHLAAIKSLPETRADKIEAAREALANGTLNSDEMLDKAIEIMIAESNLL